MTDPARAWGDARQSVAGARRSPTDPARAWGDGGASPGTIPAMPEPAPTVQPSVCGRLVLARPLKLLTLVVTRRDDRGRPIDFDGLTPDDRETLRWLKRTTLPIEWPELLARAEDAGYALLIRSDLPRID